MTIEDREQLVEIGMNLITGELSSADIEEVVIDSYLSRRREIPADKLEKELMEFITELYTTLCIREATIVALAETVDFLERE